MVILMTTTMTKTTMLMMMMVVVVVVISAIMTSVGVGHAMKARSCNHDLSFTVFLLSCLLIRPRRCLVLSLFTTPTSSTLPRTTARMRETTTASLASVQPLFPAPRKEAKRSVRVFELWKKRG